MDTNRKREIRKCSRRNRNKRRRYNDSKQSMNHYKKLSILELAIQKKVQYNSTKNGIYRIKKTRKRIKEQLGDDRQIRPVQNKNHSDNSQTFGGIIEEKENIIQRKKRES
ncbi:hypothetical protein M0812_10555 [Anaeramoeba flamelloides]|uniref:Uncharacterized protein n=1 Tax=Anaeramoeba flamelloides TaxID=1746091 RepID=A0AAV7ZUB1_9EUKA|nr:hypothetical protein M0812_10555 [Anaeramoeba flamelloides]